MRRKLCLGISLLTAAAYALAGGGTGQFNVNITLNASPAGAASCINASISGSSSISVQVRCSSNVFVAIGPATSTRTLQTISTLQPSRGSASPDACPDGSDPAGGIACQSADAGMVTVLAIPHAERRFGPVEMLVIF